MCFLYYLNNKNIFREPNKQITTSGILINKQKKSQN